MKITAPLQAMYYFTVWLVSVLEDYIDTTQMAKVISFHNYLAVHLGILDQHKTDKEYTRKHQQSNKIDH